MAKTERPHVRTRWSNLRNPFVPKTPPENCKTQQQFKDECDMNRIVKNAMRGVAPAWLNSAQPQYGDFSEVPNIGDAYDLVGKAEAAFMNLPAQLRLELGNDPRNLNTLTRDQATRHGLLKKAPEPDPVDPAISALTDATKALQEATKPRGGRGSGGTPDA